MTSRLAVSVSVAILLLFGSAGSQSTGPPPQVISGYNGLRPADYFFASLEVETHMDTTGRLITREYSYLDAQGQTEVVETLELPVNYWPTSVVSLKNRHLIVSGKTTSGRTKIEEWVFDGALIEQLMSGGSTSIVGGQLTSKRLVSSEFVSGRDMVQAMAELRGSTPPSILAMFYDSKDIYEVGLATGAKRLLASPNPSSGASFVEPLLGTGRLRRDILAREHISDGFVYFLREDTGTVLPDGPGDPSLIILKDVNKDGVIDEIAGMTQPQWALSPYLTSDQFID